MTPSWFTAALATYPRIAIAGGPSSGKTTLAGKVTDRPVFSTDALMATPWEQVPEKVIARARELGESWVIEGVQVPRALRRGLQPDLVIYLGGKPHEKMTTGQLAMAIGVRTVFEEWKANKPGDIAIMERK